VDGNAAVRPTEQPSNCQLDFKTIRRALRTIEQRKALGEFIKGG
jgi:hypothetical protein